MARKLDRSSSKVGVKTTGPVPYSNPGTGTAARKYFSSGQVQNNDANNLAITPNAEHLVGHASTLKTLSDVATAAAVQGQANLISIRASLTQVQPSLKGNDQSPVKAPSADDVKTSRAALISSVLSAVDVGSQDSQTASRYTLVTQTSLENGSNSFMPVVQQGLTTNDVNAAVPNIDYVAIEMDKRRGTTDCFFARIAFSIPQSAQGSVDAFRIFKSSLINPKFVRQPGRLSVHAVDRLMSQNTRSSSKNDDYTSISVSRLNESGVDNAVQALNPVDQIRGVRISSDALSRMTSSISVTPNFSSGNAHSVAADVAPFLNGASFASLDKSVSQDPATLRRLQTQNPGSTQLTVSQGVSVGRSIISDQNMGAEQLRQNAATTQNKSSVVIAQGNQQEFREIAFLTPSKLKQTFIGDRVQYTLDDEAIAYGRGYRYYIVSVDENIRESTRSPIVDVTIEGIRIPDPPDMVVAQNIGGWVALGIKSNDHLIEKFEIYRSEQDHSNRRIGSLDIDVVSGKDGFVKESTTVFRAANDFIQIGESLNSVSRGSNFYDKLIVPGYRYNYRIYAVDIFGNKSADAYQLSFFVPDPQSKKIELKKPSILAEVDAQTNQSRLTFSCEDPRVKSFLLTRRDMTLDQSAFTTPGQVSSLRMGKCDVRGSARFQDVILNDKSVDSAWVGNFTNDGTEQVFVDLSSEIEHVYQYRVQGVDLFGNSTQFAVSAPVSLVNRPMINPPVSLSASVVVSSVGFVDGISLSWVDGNVNISSEEMLGPQTSQGGVADTAVRSMFQIQRKMTGEDLWYSYPMVTGSYFYDLAFIPGREQTFFNPPLLEIDQEYQYRVQAFQTGAFISNFCVPISITARTSPAAPTNFNLVASDTKIRPLYAILNWDVDPLSGIIDSWQIERAAANNYAAGQLNSRNPAGYQNLVYSPFRTVYLESNHFRSTVMDSVVASQNSAASTMTTGDNYTMDMNVSLGNTYFYRIRAVATDGTLSPWTYRGMKMTDNTHESVMNAILTSDEKSLLSQNFQPLNLKSSVLSTAFDLSQSSLSLIPTKSKPIQPPAAKVSPPSVVGQAIPKPTLVPTYVQPNQPNLFGGQPSTVIGKI
jgi:hypothetical protein